MVRRRASNAAPPLHRRNGRSALFVLLSSATGTSPPRLPARYAGSYQPIAPGNFDGANTGEIQLETPQAIEHADAIAAVPGIDMVHIGALDVSNVMGIPAAYSDPRMRAVFEKVARACKAHGKAMGVGGARGDRQMQQYLIGLGVRYLTTGSDVGYLMAAAKADVAAVRGLKA